MEIEEARKILGKTAKDLSDDQIRDVIANFDFLASSWLNDYEKKIFNGKTLAEMFPEMNLYKDFKY